MDREYLKRAVAALVILAAFLGARAQEPVPASVYIDGVPFVGYHAARDAEFPGSDVTNPSYAAVAQMMFGYWGEDFLVRARAGAMPEGWTQSGGEDGSPGDLKALLARGIPVIVVPATTPEAHRLYPMTKMWAELQSVAYEAPHATSGALGEMISHRAVEELREGGCEMGLNDSVILASRLLLGYDEERQVFIMHDPSLGPNLEFGYEEFLGMWRVTGGKYWAYHPEAIPAEPPGRRADVRARTADDEAAVALFRAYGLEITGLYPRAESLLREALTREGLSVGRRHLLGLELAVSLNESGRCAEAVEVARQANAVFGDYALAHAVLGNLLACSGDPAASREAKREMDRARSLCGEEVQRRVADVLGRDFPVMGCNGQILGWVRP